MRSKFLIVVPGVLIIVLGIANGTPAAGKTCGCPSTYQPACGSDDETYTNSCELNCAKRTDPQLYEKYPAPCRNSPTRSPPTKPPQPIPQPTTRYSLSVQPNNQYESTHTCNCILALDPVCGSDGKTYLNPCGLNCAAQDNRYLRIEYNGNCQISPNQILPVQSESRVDICACDLMLNPVCGSDGKTYPNDCSLDCESRKDPSKRLSKVRDGACSTVCYCPAIYAPVCGSDGETHPNECVLNCENRKDPSKRISKVREGECQAQLDCPPCNLIYDPVCASDGKTYGNQCELDCEIKINPSKRLSKVRNGVCQSQNPSQPTLYPDQCGPCPSMYDPMCGSDRKTYNNKCEFDCVAKSNPSLRIIHRGRCT